MIASGRPAPANRPPSPPASRRSSEPVLGQAGEARQRALHRAPRRARREGHGPLAAPLRQPGAPPGGPVRFMIASGRPAPANRPPPPPASRRSSEPVLGQAGEARQRALHRAPREARREVHVPSAEGPADPV